PTMPMIDFRVVVLPAPLRPTSVTSSPLRTSRSTPCKTCDSPYQAWSPRASSMLGSQVRGLHRGVLRDLRVVAFRQHLAAGQHGDALRDAGDDAHVVLDHQHGAALRGALDERGDAVHVLVAPAGGG